MNAKLILVIMRGGSCEKLLHKLHDAGFRVTEVSSMGTFLRRRNTTLLIGLPAEQVDDALEMIRAGCAEPAGPDEHNATIFVLDAEQFVHF